MGDEQQPPALQRCGEPHLVDGGHHGLAGAGRSDEQVAMPAVATGNPDLLEQPLLEENSARTPTSRASNAAPLTDAFAVSQRADRGTDERRDVSAESVGRVSLAEL